MNAQLSSNIWSILMCPYCGHDLDQQPEGGRCGQCQTSYEYTNSGVIDLRLKSPKTINHKFKLGEELCPPSGIDFKPLSAKPSPEVDFTGVSVPKHLSKELMSHFPKGNGKRCLMLDLGCGSTIHRDVCEHAGYEYVGLDYSSSNASIIGDAHTLPFKTSSFEFILSIAVAEHIRFPFVMMHEAHRVLKGGGKFIGTVAFLEPFHGDSFYHHTHLGIYNSLKHGGFNIEQIAPSADWSVLVALAKNALFPKMPHLLSRSLVVPLHSFHKLWWRLISLKSNRFSDTTRIRNTTGSFTFIATK